MEKFLTELFKCFDEAGVLYLVLRNHETLPETTANDVDMLIDGRQRRLAERITREVVQKTGWRIHSRVEFSCLSYYFHRPETQEQRQVDFMSGISWHSLLYGDGGAMLRRRVPCKRFYIPSAHDEAMVSLAGSGDLLKYPAKSLSLVLTILSLRRPRIHRSLRLPIPNR